jgi:hypothetical protein
MQKFPKKIFKEQRLAFFAEDFQAAVVKQIESADSPDEEKTFEAGTDKAALQAKAAEVDKKIQSLNLNDSDKSKLQKDVQDFIKKALVDAGSLTEYNADSFDIDGEAGLDVQEFEQFTAKLNQGIGYIVDLGGYGDFQKIKTENVASQSASMDGLLEKGAKTADEFIANLLGKDIKEIRANREEYLKATPADPLKFAAGILMGMGEFSAEMVASVVQLAYDVGRCGVDLPAYLGCVAKANLGRLQIWKSLDVIKKEAATARIRAGKILDQNLALSLLALVGDGLLVNSGLSMDGEKNRAVGLEGATKGLFKNIPKNPLAWKAEAVGPTILAIIPLLKGRVGVLKKITKRWKIRKVPKTTELAKVTRTKEISEGVAKTTKTTESVGATAEKVKVSPRPKVEAQYTPDYSGKDLSSLNNKLAVERKAMATKEAVLKRRLGNDPEKLKDILKRSDIIEQRARIKAMEAEIAKRPATKLTPTKKPLRITHQADAVATSPAAKPVPLPKVKPTLSQKPLQITVDAGKKLKKPSQLKVIEGGGRTPALAGNITPKLRLVVSNDVQAAIKTLKLTGKPLTQKGVVPLVLKRLPKLPKKALAAAAALAAVMVTKEIAKENDGQAIAAEIENPDPVVPVIPDAGPDKEDEDNKPQPNEKAKENFQSLLDAVNSLPYPNAIRMENMNKNTDQFFENLVSVNNLTIKKEIDATAVGANKVKQRNSKVGGQERTLKLQVLLQSVDPNLKADGLMGPNTITALKKFIQKKIDAVAK